MIATKKSQIGATLTWFISFLIIFFILIAFLSFSTALGAKKEIGMVFTSGNKPLDVKQFSGATQNRDSIISILESRVFYNHTDFRIVDLLKLTTNGDKELLNFLVPQLKTRLNASCEEYGFSFLDINLKSAIGFTEDFALSSTTLFIPSENNTFEIKYYRGQCL